MGADAQLSGREISAHYGVRNDFGLELSAAPSFPVVGGLLHSVSAVSKSRRLERPDVYWARNAHSLAGVAGRGIPFVYEAHDLPGSRARETVERFLFGRTSFHRLVVISEALRAAYLERFAGHLSEPQVLAIHDGADLVEDTVEMAALGGRAGALQVGYTGHLYDGRGIEVVLSAAERLADVDVHLVGGTELDLERWKRRSIEEWNVDNVTFHGHRPNAEVPSFLRAFDVVLAPYQRRVAVAGGGGDTSRFMSPLKIFEYMGGGLAIIASRLDVLQEVLRDGENALLCDPEDVDEWCRAVERLRDDPALRSSLGRQAQSEIADEYSWDRRVSTVLSTLG